MLQRSNLESYVEKRLVLANGFIFLSKRTGKLEKEGPVKIKMKVEEIQEQGLPLQLETEGWQAPVPCILAAGYLPPELPGKLLFASYVTMNLLLPTEQSPQPRNRTNFQKV